MIIHKHDDDDDESKNADSCDDDLIRIQGIVTTNTRLDTTRKGEKGIAWLSCDWALQCQAFVVR